MLLGLSTLVYPACVGDPASGGGAASSPDASLAEGGTTPGSGPAPGDTAADAGVDAVARTTVTVTAIRESTHAPEAGASVVFYPPSGEPQIVVTDANGTATAELPAGGTVTAVFGTKTSPRLVTVLGAERGDALTVLDPDLAWDWGTRIGFKITSPGTPPAGTLRLGLAFGECITFPDANGACSVSNGCVRSAAVPSATLLALGAGDKILATTSGTSISLGAGQPIPIAFPGQWINAAPDVSLTGTGFPTYTISGFSAVLPRLAHLEGREGGLVGWVLAPSESAATYAGAFTPRVAGATYAQNELYAYEDQTAAPSGLVTRALAVRGAPGASATVDFAAALPRITSTTLGASNLLPTVTFASDGPLSSTKAIVTKVRWNGDGSGPAIAGSWLVVAPPSTAAITPPALPASLVDYAPSSRTSWVSPAFVAAFDGTVFPDYAAIRAAGLVLSPALGLELGKHTAIAPLLPADGTLKLTAYGPRL